MNFEIIVVWAAAVAIAYVIHLSLKGKKEQAQANQAK